MGDLENTLLTWLPIVFFGVVIVLLLYTLRFMPRAKPAPVVKGSQVEVSWNDVAGLDEAKEELQEVVDFLRDRKRFERLGARCPAGSCCTGRPEPVRPSSRAVASASGANFCSQSASSFVEMFAGLGAARIRKLFEEARSTSLRSSSSTSSTQSERARAGGGFHREHDQTLNQLLVELDGFSRDEVVVMAASNLQDLDPACCAPVASIGRFASPLPTWRAARRFLGVHTRDKPLAADVDLGLVASRRPGSGADLRRSLQRGGDPRRAPGQVIRHSDFDASMERIVAGLAAARRLRAREADPRVPRGRPRGHVPSSASCSRLEGDDRLADRRSATR